MNKLVEREVFIEGAELRFVFEVPTASAFTWYRKRPQIVKLRKKNGSGGLEASLLIFVE